MDPVKLHKIIGELIVLRGKEESKTHFVERLGEKITEALQQLLPCQELETKLSQTDKVTVKFVTISLFSLKQIASNEDELKYLISIQQQQKINIILQMVFSLGVACGLSQGVNIYLAHKTAESGLVNLEDLSQKELYDMMVDVVRSLLELVKAPNLRALILRHLGDMMSALIQLVYITSLKKSAKNENRNSKDQKPRDALWTDEFREQVRKDRVEFKNLYNELVENVYKPLVIKELIILMSVPRDRVSSNFPPPMWLRNNISRQITGYLVSPGGVSLLMRAIFNKPVEKFDWKKVRAIAGMIAKDLGFLPRNEYYARICPQIISCLNTTGPYCEPVAKACIWYIYNERPDICEKYMLDLLLEPFLLCSQPIKENFDGILISEDSLSRGIDHLNKCFSPGSEESTLPFKVLIKIIKIKFKLYMKIAESPYQHKPVIQDLLVRFFHSFDNRDELAAIYNALIFNEPYEGMLDMNKELEFEFGPSGGIQVVKSSKANTSSFSNPQIELKSEVAGDFMLDLLSHDKNYSKKLLFDLFVIILSSMAKWYDESIDAPDVNQDLLSAEELIMYVVGKSEKKMICIKLLAVLAENVEVMDSMQEAPELIFKFVETLLNKKSESILSGKDDSCCSNEENEDDDFDKDGSPEDVIVTLGIVDVMTMNMKIGGVKWECCKPLLKPLKIIRNNCNDTFIKFLANSLYEKIMTRGAVSGSKNFPGDLLKHENDANSKKSDTKKKVGENSRINVNKSTKASKRRNLILDLNKTNDDKSEFETAVGEACSEDVPTRGHGLIQLARLIKKKDAETLARKSTVLTVFKESLRHEDTYVYLAAINGLEVLANINTDDVLELLTREYSDDKIDTDLKMKVGEVLVRVSRVLGKMIPKYKGLLVSTFLLGAKHEDEFVRASSLSNLGEVLKILSFSVGAYLQEVYVCVQSIAATDKADVARRAAVMVAKLLLSGVKESTFMIIEPVIVDLHRTLLHICKTDKDEVTRLQADLALAEIDRLVRASFDRSMKLEKHIGIFSLSLKDS